MEDSEIDILVADRLIRSHNPTLKPIITNNGMQAIKLLKERKLRGQGIPSFILLDLVMPYMDGFDFLEVYERDVQIDSIEPNVIVLTSSIHEIDKKEALKFKSVKAYMVKPFNIREFERIRI